MSLSLLRSPRPSRINLGAIGGWEVTKTPWPLYSKERTGTHCTGEWVGLGAGLDACGRSRPAWSLNSEQSSPWRVATPTQLFPVPIAYFKLTNSFKKSTANVPYRFYTTHTISPYLSNRFTIQHDRSVDGKCVPKVRRLQMWLKNRFLVLTS